MFSIEKLKWYLNRWINMQHPKEDIYRIRQQIQYHIIDRYKRKFLPIAPSPFYKLRPFSKNPSWKISKFKLEHKIFNITIDLNQPILWRKDYKNNIVSTKYFSSNIKKSDFINYGEIKYVFELNRFHHLPYLAYAYIQTKDSSIIGIIRTHINDWIEQNPYLNSINWTSGIEVSIRVVNWIFTRIILSDQIEDVEIINTLDEWIWLHFIYLKNHLSKYSSANNHFIAELLGIIAITSTYKFRNSEKYLYKYFSIIENEIINQTYIDGHNKEQSFRYHAATMNSIFAVLFFIRDKKFNFQQSVKQRIYNMAKIIKEHLDKDCNFIDFGDNDDSELLVDKNDIKYHLYYSLLTSSAIYFKNPSLLCDHSYYDFRNQLLFGNEGFKTFEALNKIYRKKKNKYLDEYNKTKIYPESGYLIIKDDQTQFIFDFGSIGFSNLAAHGHSDLFHFTFSYDGIPFVIDSGTYQYHSRYKKWRKYFRGAMSHNTISIDNFDQAKQAGSMAWLKKPSISHVKYNISGNKLFCEAIHNGYQRQNLNVLHKRKINYNKSEKEYSIIDILTSKDKHKATFLLHLHPDLDSVLLSGNRLILTKSNRIVVIENDRFLNAQLFKGDSKRPLGWYSFSYDHKIPTWTLKLDINFNKELTLNTFITFYNKK